MKMIYIHDAGNVPAKFPCSMLSLLHQYMIRVFCKLFLQTMMTAAMTLMMMTMNGMTRHLLED